MLRNDLLRCFIDGQLALVHAAKLHIATQHGHRHVVLHADQLSFLARFHLNVAAHVVENPEAVMEARVLRGEAGILTRALTNLCTNTRVQQYVLMQKQAVHMRYTSTAHSEHIQYAFNRLATMCSSQAVHAQ